MRAEWEGWHVRPGGGEEQGRADTGVEKQTISAAGVRRRQPAVLLLVATAAVARGGVVRRSLAVVRRNVYSLHTAQGST